MDWFERLTGFPESSYEETRRRLELDGRRLRSLVNGASYAIGEFAVSSLEAIRAQALSGPLPDGRLAVLAEPGDVRALHAEPQFAGALFQVASQFNMLEMTAPDVTPEHGVGRYECDRTQGPACAMAAGAATIFRNYLVPLPGRCGQTREHQLNGLKAVGAALERSLGVPVRALWDMRNGYALCTQSGLEAISAYLGRSPPEELERLRGKLCIGLHYGAEVTDAPTAPRPVVSQAFCAALPLAYSPVPARHWEAFARLILDAAYEATLWAALVNAQSGGSRRVLLTSLGGGAFGNPAQWIAASLRRALERLAAFDLEVRIVTRGAPSAELRQIVRDFAPLRAR